MPKKEKKESKAKKLIRKGAGVPFKRPWQKREPVQCKQVSVFFGIINFGVNLLKPRHLYMVRTHVRHCKTCNVICG